MGGAVPLRPARLHQPPFKPYVRVSRIRLTGDLLVQHARLRVAYRPAQSVQALIPKPLPVPLCGLAAPKVPTPSLHHEALESPVDVAVELVELLRSVPDAEVVAPATQHGVQVIDDD